MFGTDFEFTFDEIRGSLQRWIFRGQSLIEPDIDAGTALYVSCWRPATDNDVAVALPYWRLYGLDQLKIQLRSISFNTSNPNSIAITVHSYLSPPALGWGWNC